MKKPYSQHAPWPTMRADLRNTGVFPGLGEWKGLKEKVFQPRRFHTDGPIFSTPVIGEKDTVYVGSADHSFYAWNPVRHSLEWSYDTKEAIDSAGSIDSEGTIYFPGCDGIFRALSPEGTEQWTFDVIRKRTRPTPSTIFWWEGNTSLGPDGNIYAGNDDFYLYSLTKEGKVRWQFPTGLNIWSTPAFYSHVVVFASFDFYLYALDTETGAEVWKTQLDNFIVASPAITKDGIAYIGTLGGTLYAVDVENGIIRWQHSLADHIYASVALSDDDDTLYVGDASGAFYAFSTVTHEEMWRFDAGSPIRASASIGPTLSDEHAYNIYIGDDEGYVYALTPEGEREWTYDTYRSTDAVSHAINASVAIGDTGIVVANIAGDIIWIPYGYTQRTQERPSIEVRPRKAVTPGTYTFTFTNVVFNTPAIISSFDLIAIASVEYVLTLSFSKNGLVSGTGTVEFGSPDGADGVVIPRVHTYNFTGTISSDGVFSVCARDCPFELSAFPMNVDELHFEGVFDGLSVHERSIRIIKKKKSFVQNCFELFSSESLRFLHEYLKGFFRSRKKLQFLKMSLRATLVALRVLRPSVQRGWRLIDENGLIDARGTYAHKKKE